MRPREGRDLLYALSGLVSEPGQGEKAEGLALALPQEGGEARTGKGLVCSRDVGLADCGKPGAPGSLAGGSPVTISWGVLDWGRSELVGWPASWAPMR